MVVDEEAKFDGELAKAESGIQRSREGTISREDVGD